MSFNERVVAVRDHEGNWHRVTKPGVDFYRVLCGLIVREPRDLSTSLGRPRRDRCSSCYE